jgi:hypothetical protein
MRSPFSRLVPNSAEVGGIAFASLLIVLIGNAKDLLNYYGLISSSDVIQSQLSSSFGSGLSKLDSFSVTPTVVTFGIWGLVGLTTLSIVQAILRVTGEIAYEKQVSSNDYIHPGNFSRQSYWAQITFHTLISLALWVLLAGVALAYLFGVIPLGFTYARHFLLHATLPGIGYLLLGLTLVFVGTLALYTCLKLVMRHHWAPKE